MRGGLGAGVELVDAGRDLGVLALEQRVAGEIAVDQERPEVLHLQHPDGLGEAQLLDPVRRHHALDAAASSAPVP